MKKIDQGESNFLKEESGTHGGFATFFLKHFAFFKRSGNVCYE